MEPPGKPKLGEDSRAGIGHWHMWLDRSALIPRTLPKVLKAETCDDFTKASKQICINLLVGLKEPDGNRVYFSGAHRHLTAPLTDRNGFQMFPIFV